MPIEKRGKTWRAYIWTGGRGSRRMSKTFSTKAAALGWERDMQSAKERGLIVLDPSDMTVSQAAEAMCDGMENGSVLNRSGQRYRLNVAQQYRDLFTNHLKPEIGTMRFVDVKRKDLQGLIATLMAKNLKPSTVRNAFKPLQVLFRRALDDELIAVNPALRLNLPKGTGKRERAVSPEMAAKLIAALKPEDQALWGCAFYAGLRKGEIAALRWPDIDFKEGLIHVSRGYDWRNREFIDTKTESGKRKVPLLSLLRELLEAQRNFSDESGLIFGATAQRPFSDTNIRKRALTAWRKKPDLKPITLHEARHTFASMLLDRNIPILRVSRYLGHSDIRTTLNIYGHLLPGAHAEDAAVMDEFLAPS